MILRISSGVLISEVFDELFSEFIQYLHILDGSFDIWKHLIKRCLLIHDLLHIVVLYPQEGMIELQAFGKDSVGLNQCFDAVTSLFDQFA